MQNRKELEMSRLRRCCWSTEEEMAELARRLDATCVVPDAIAAAVRVPFRVCPLGAHVDHQGGQISGMALEFGVSLIFKPRTDRRVHMTSCNFSGEVSFSLDDIPPCRRCSSRDEENNWGNFPRGAARALLDSGYRLQNGMSGMLMAPDRLDSSGISSSAAVGTACLLALEHINGLQLDISQNIELDRLIENEYLGLKNGIMDQSIVLGARQGLLTVVDCKSRAIEHISPPWVQSGARCPYSILMAFSGLRAALAAAPDFNNRVAECHAAAAALLQHLGRPDAPALLGQVTHQEHAEHKAVLGDSALAWRAEHYFTETARVAEGARLWQAGDIVGFGRLINLSGQSSAVNYEVGSEQLKFLQGVLHSLDGVYGARFSGAGTRGACVALVHADRAEEVAEKVLVSYAEQFPELAGAAQVVVSTSGEGARFVPLL